MADSPRIVDLAVGALGLLTGAWNTVLALAVLLGGGLAATIGVEVASVSALLGALLFGLGIAMLVAAVGLLADRPWGWFVAGIAWGGAYLKNLADAVATGSISVGMLVVLVLDLGILAVAVASIERFPRLDADFVERAAALGAVLPGIASRRSDEGSTDGDPWDGVDELARAVVDGLRDAGYEANVRTHDDWTFVLAEGGGSDQQRLLWLTVEEAVTKERVQRFHELAQNAGVDRGLVVYEQGVAVPGQAMADELGIGCHEASAFLSRL